MCVARVNGPAVSAHGNIPLQLCVIDGDVGAVSIQVEATAMEHSRVIHKVGVKYAYTSTGTSRRNATPMVSMIAQECTPRDNESPGSINHDSPACIIRNSPAAQN